MTVRDLLDRFVFVRTCGGCKELLEYELRHDAFCPSCRIKWNQVKVEPCPSCHGAAVECACMPKGLSSSGALSLRKLMFYSPKRMREPQNRMIYRIKHKPSRRISLFLAKEMLPAVEAELKVLGLNGKTDAVLVSVPRGRRARATYGFDQSELLCQALSEQSEIPYAPIIQRKRGGKEQKKLGKDRRFRNIQSLFFLDPACSVNGKYVFLLDDVVTTGASMAAGVNLMKKAGAKAIICLCIAQN